jgi:hypothetical protein
VNNAIFFVKKKGGILVCLLPCGVGWGLAGGQGVHTVVVEACCYLWCMVSKGSRGGTRTVIVIRVMAHCYLMLGGNPLTSPTFLIHPMVFCGDLSASLSPIDTQ